VIPYTKLKSALGRLCAQAGLGQEAREVLEELGEIQIGDVVLPRRSGGAIRKRCISRPSEHQAILLTRLGLTLPASLEQQPM